MLASIKSQMNPHFLFNALNTIQAYIYTNDKENASVYLGKFSELTRRILDMSNKDSVPLSEEIKALSLYLELEKYDLKTSFIIPSTLTQPFNPILCISRPCLFNPMSKMLLNMDYYTKRRPTTMD
jgi:LytS/YehU family sensor histidine kinase